MAFKKFPKISGGTLSCHPADSGTLTGQGQIILAYPRILTYFPDKMGILYYDDEQGLIGIEPTYKGDKEGYTLSLPYTIKTPDGEREQSVLSAKKLINFYGLEEYKKKCYAMTWDDEQKMLIIDLKNVVKVLNVEEKPAKEGWNQVENNKPC